MSTIRSSLSPRFGDDWDRIFGKSSVFGDCREVCVVLPDSLILISRDEIEIRGISQMVLSEISTHGLSPLAFPPKMTFVRSRNNNGDLRHETAIFANETGNCPDDGDVGHYQRFVVRQKDGEFVIEPEAQ